MLVLSHRGYWLKPQERNTLAAFERSFSLGYGTETDIRDHCCKLVISHDMPNSNSLPIEAFFDVHKKYNARLPLALNIKADGLQDELARLLSAYEVSNYFVFDMAVPDGLQYIHKNIRVFTRQSEFETLPAFYEDAEGVWLDEFLDHWISDEIIEKHLSHQKSLCLVSPDLHKRAHKEAWEHYRRLEARIGRNRLMICTDFPEEAQEYFNE